MPLALERINAAPLDEAAALLAQVAAEFAAP
jgi:hypothetical protein